MNNERPIQNGTPRDFNVTEHEESIGIASDFILQLNFKYLKKKKYLSVNFAVVLKKNIHNFLKRLLNCSSLFQLHISVRTDFLHRCQPEQHFTTGNARSRYENKLFSFIKLDNKEI